MPGKTGPRKSRPKSKTRSQSGSQPKARTASARSSGPARTGQQQPGRPANRRGTVSTTAGLIDASAPERNQILDCLEQAGRPLDQDELEQALKVRGAGAQEILRRRLQAMLRDGQVIQNRRGAFGVTARMDLIAGRVVAHRDGYGFLIPDEGGDDLFLSAREMRSVLHGDRALASVVGVDARGRREGRVREVLERANATLVGRFVEESGIALVVPDDSRIAQDVLIPLPECNGAKPGQVVVVAITRQPTGKEPPLGKIIRVLGDAGAPGMAVEIAIHNHGIPHEWPAGVEEEARHFGTRVPESMLAGRMDLRELPLVTIDGADARDFDDAVYAQRTRKGWRLVVAIADVSSYVQPASLLDAEAQERATSVYFPNRVVPMLPEALSNGLCSLKPDEDRLCLVCDMSVDERGRVSRSRFVSAVMRSRARLTYDQVWGWFSEQRALPVDPGPDGLASLQELYALYKVLRKAREQRGAIDFESAEVVFRFDTNGSVAGLDDAERHDAHKLIEECMILANVEAAHFLQQSGLPGPYRVHAPPPATKLEALTEFLRSIGIKPPWREQPTPADFEYIVKQVAGRPDEKLVMAVLLRAQSLAAYKPDNQGHFGLALEAYAHFTSPIRRYPDLLLHRAIHHHIARAPSAGFTHGAREMERLCEQCSHRSRRAEEAEREVHDRLKCLYMEQHVGMVFPGMVSGVTSFGLFVELDHGAVNGLVHVSSLPSDYYHFDPVRHRLSGERHQRVFQLADRVRVRVAAVNLEDRKIDFALEEA